MVDDVDGSLENELAGVTYDIRSMRFRKGLSQTGLARMAGISQAHVAKIEMGKVDPRLSTMTRILMVLVSERSTYLFHSMLKDKELLDLEEKDFEIRAGVKDGKADVQ